MSQDINDLLKDAREKSWRQLDAIHALGEYPTPQVISTLIKLLDIRPNEKKSYREYNDPPVEVDSRSLESLVESHVVRWEAAKSIVNIGEPAVGSLLNCLFESDQRGYDFVDRAVMWTLGEINDDRAVEPLNQIFTNSDSSYHNQRYAINAMSKIGGTPIKYLIDALKGEIPELAASALAAMGSSSVEPLMQAINSNDTELCRYIVDILSEIGDLRAIDAFIKIMSFPKEENKDTFNYSGKYRFEKAYYLIREALRKMGAPAIDGLIQALNEKEKETKLGAVRALGLIGNPKSVQSLIKTTGVDDSDVAYAALGSLRRTIGELEHLSHVESVVDLTLITKPGHVPGSPGNQQIRRL